MGGRAIIDEDARQFAERFEGGGALLGFDLGTKRIGLAVCDPSWRFASPIATLARTKFSRDLQQIRKLVEERGVVGLVVGWPRNMDGSLGQRAQSARAYAQNLGQQLSLPVLLWDERWSTIEAQSAMIAQDLSRAKRAQKIDSHAAAVILQGAIDAMTSSAF